MLRIRVVAEQANIRLSPDISSIIIKQVPLGTILESPGKTGEWYQVRLEEKDKPADGFVHESLVTVIEQATLTEREQQRESQIDQQEERKEVSPPPPILKPPKPSGPRFDLRIKWGGIYATGGDINRGAQGLADYLSDIWRAPGTGEATAAHLGTIPGGEFGIRLVPNLYLYAGADRFLIKKESIVEFQSDSPPQNLTTRPEIKALPLQISLAFYPISHIYVKAGINYYFASCSYYYRIQSGEFWQEWKGDSDAQSFGLFGGLGIERIISSPIRLFLEALWRQAKIDGFEGENVYQDSEGISSVENGTLYSYAAEVSEGKSYPLLFIRERPPSEPDVINPKPAVIDFSGLSLAVGIRVRF